MDFIIVTGLSGSGKTIAINALEDIGFFCVDNLPPSLISKFAGLSQEGNGSLSKIAIVTDTRGQEMFKDLLDVLKGLEVRSFEYKILFLDATDESIIRRFKETRRKHPLLKTDDCVTIEQAIQKERDILSPIKEISHFIIDTSHYSNSQLKSSITKLFLSDSQDGIIINCESFGFKYGTPPYSDLVFDVRCLPNPFYIKEMQSKTGLDKKVYEYVKSFEQTQIMLKKLEDLIDFLIPLYIEEGKSQLTIAFGCTGGKHRSVTFAIHFYEYLKRTYKNIRVTHRDIDKT